MSLCHVPFPLPFLSTSLFKATTRCSHLAFSLKCIQSLLQKALFSFFGEWTLEIQIWAQGVLVAIEISWTLLRGRAMEIHVCALPTETYTSCYGSVCVCVEKK